MTDWLWTELRDQFEVDDGSLPEVRVNYVDRRAVTSAYALLRGRGKDVTRGGGTFWSNTESKEQSLDSVPNVASLVVSGEAQPFHCVLSGIKINGAQLPDLGVFVFPDQVTLDYRMGAQWDAPTLRAFFDLLRNLANSDPGASLELHEAVLPDMAARFQHCWSRFLAEPPNKPLQPTSGR